MTTETRPDPARDAAESLAIGQPPAATFAVALDGYTDLPPGRIANVVTFLEMTEPPPAPSPLPAGFAVVRVQHPTAGWYRSLYRRIGENWLWFSRAVMPDSALSALLSASGSEVHVLRQADGTDIGMAELDASVAGEIEIVTFGVVPEAVGTGAAKMLMQIVLAYCFGRNVRRVWLHTCTFDHPAAVRFYRSRGFRGYKFAIEVSEDPRVTGHLPVTAAPHVVLLEPDSAAVRK